jgi:flagellum-specific ATP synthase
MKTLDAPTLPDLQRYRQAIATLHPNILSGRVVQVVGLTIEAVGIDAQVGEVCEIKSAGGHILLSEVVGFRNERTLLMPLGDMQGIQPGSPVYPTRSVFRAPVGSSLLGRVLDGLGQPLDGKGELGDVETMPIYNTAPHPLTRQPIREPLVTGVRAIDGLLTIGKGQRIGIFSGSGVGKSTLLGSLARNARSDISVIGLVGERGREVQEFIDRDLGWEGLKRSVVVVATSDQPALVRLKAAWVATTIAEFFRDQGADVVFMMDSVTRFAMAQREIGLAVGEPPASKGYTPSVFALLPKLLERAGTSQRGSITGLYTVLVEGDDFNEPISDAARSILDGHISLSRDLAARNHYPAIDVLHSVSRVMPAVTTEEHRKHAGHVRKLMATYEKARDLVNIGAYVHGSDAEIDASLAALPSINAFLQQPPEQASSFEEMLTMLSAIGNPE